MLSNGLIKFIFISIDFWGSKLGSEKRLLAVEDSSQCNYGCSAQPSWAQLWMNHLWAFPHPRAGDLRRVNGKNARTGSEKRAVNGSLPGYDRIRQEHCMHQRLATVASCIRPTQAQANQNPSISGGGGASSGCWLPLGKWLMVDTHVPVDGPTSMHIWAVVIRLTRLLVTKKRKGHKVWRVIELWGLKEARGRWWWVDIIKIHCINMWNFERIYKNILKNQFH